MKCPFCGYLESKVLDSRPAEGGGSIRRRRECLSCQKRFTTYEVVESIQRVLLALAATQEVPRPTRPHSRGSTKCPAHIQRSPVSAC